MLRRRRKAFLAVNPSIFIDWIKDHQIGNKIPQDAVYIHNCIRSEPCKADEAILFLLSHPTFKEVSEGEMYEELIVNIQDDYCEKNILRKFARWILRIIPK